MSGTVKEQKPLLKTPGPLFLQHTALLWQLHSRRDYQEQVACLPDLLRWVVFQHNQSELSQGAFMCIDCINTMICLFSRAFPVIHGRISVVGYILWAEFFNCSYLICPRQPESLKKFEYCSLEIFFSHLFGVDHYKFVHGRVFCPSVWLWEWNYYLEADTYGEAPCDCCQ